MVSQNLKLRHMTIQKYAQMSRFGHKKRTVHKELSVYGRGMRTCLANARQNLGVRALKCPRLKDSSNPFTILQKGKRTLRECSFSFGRGIRIRTLNNGVRDAGLLFETHRFKPNFRVCVSQKSFLNCYI